MCWLISVEIEARVEDLCDQLRATNFEQEELCIEPSFVGEVIARGKNCLLTKLLSTKYYNRRAFKATMKRVWKLGKLIRFHDMEARFMMVEFEDPSDKLRVLYDDPWNFNKSLTLLKDFKGGQQIKNITMNKVSF